MKASADQDFTDVVSGEKYCTGTRNRRLLNFNLKKLLVLKLLIIVDLEVQSVDQKETERWLVPRDLGEGMIRRTKIRQYLELIA